MSSRTVIIDPDGDTLIILPIADEFKSNNANGTAPLSSPSNNKQRNQQEGNEATSVHKVEFKVSMKHLTTASHRAKVMFAGPFKESARHELDGLRHWEFEAIFNPGAFEIVLNSIHAQNHQIPREVSIAMMADIAVVVDDLMCQNSLDFFARLWFDKLKYKMPSVICKDLSRFILISSVFRDEEQFVLSTMVAIQHCTGSITSHGLPIRPQILEAIKRERESRIILLMACLNGLIETLGLQSKTCTPACTAMMLGSLIQNLRSQNIWPITLSNTLHGHSMLSIMRNVNTFKSPLLFCKADKPQVNGTTWNRQSASSKYVNAPRRQRQNDEIWPNSDLDAAFVEVHDHSLKQVIEPALEKVRKKMDEGLSLKAFTQ